jgi:molybdate transport system substrate-binding protein
MFKVRGSVRTLIAVLFFVVTVSWGNVSWAEGIRVAVASNFLTTAQQLVKTFEAQSPYRVQLSAASSGKFYAQIRQGAPYDIFLSADAERPQRLYREGIGQQSPITYAVGQLVLWQPLAKQPVDQHSLIKNTDARLAIANPRVAPYGQAAQQIMQQMGLWDKLKKRMVRGENIGQVFQFVRSGNAARGFVALSQVTAVAIPQAQWWQVPANLYPPINQQALLIQDKPGANAFWQYLQSDDARALIQRSGYAL